MPPYTLADLDESPEAKILAAYAEVVRADPLLADCFKPILVVETTGRDGLLAYGVGTLMLHPVAVRKEDFPMGRETVLVSIAATAFLKAEETEENSDLVGLNLGNHFRKLGFLNQQLDDPDNAGFHMTLATIDFSVLTPLLTTTGVRILTYRTVYETDITPSTGAFAS